MRASVAFGDERLDFEVDDDRVVGAWEGPAGLAAGEVESAVLEALERPIEFPPLRQALVPGDRVVIPFDPEVPEADRILGAVCETLRGAGVEAASMLVLATGPGGSGWETTLPPGVAGAVHDPDDRGQLAYLASTEQGRRVYLNRHLTDADAVVPVGLLGYDPVLGYRGPWGALFPGLSDSETLRDFRALASDQPPDPSRERPALAESARVSWLLGSQFHVGVLPAAEGFARAVAGLDSAVRARGALAVEASWHFRAPEAADVVVAGIGAPDRTAGVAELARGLSAARRAVRRGGKIVVLSRAEGPFGPSLRRLADAGDPREGLAALRGLEGEPDQDAARAIARALDWADIYLLSALPEDDVESLSMIALGRPEEARRLATAAASCLFLSRADRTRVEVADEDEP